MKYGMDLKSEGALDLVSLGALVHRLDPGIIPFRKATDFKVHVSGGEFNVRAKTHIQRAGVLKGKAAGGIIQLQG